jgi:C_GCAxxG_C_C family probable redox protein
MTSKQADEAVAAFKRGLSCSQAILSVYGRDLGVAPETAEKVASVFGAGVARTGEICGAVSGALMVIGLSQRPEDIQDASSREKVYAKARRFIEEFKARNASVHCTELVGYDLSDPKQFAEAREKKVFATRCSNLVRDAGEILEGILS